MSYNFTVTFLGTSSGGGPNDTRSCSSLALDINESGDLWCESTICYGIEALNHGTLNSVVDCAEGTLRQFSLQRERDPSKRISVNSVSKIFVTHLHCQ